MALFSAFGRNTNDNSVRVSQTNDSYNTTTSWAQSISDVGNTKVETNKPGSAISDLVPVMIVGAVIIGLVAIARRS
jgi:hypothetical protein